MNSASSDPHAQSAYQVRFDWGRSGADAIGRDVEAIVWVDELGAAPIPDLPLGPAVVAAGLDSAGSLAAWALDRQESLGGRFRIAVVAAGATRADGGERFAVEDLLAAGAVIDALAEGGIDVEVRWNLVRSPELGGLQVHTQLSPHVAALRLYPGITRAILENFLRPPLEGLVLETFGSGNAPDRDDDLLGVLREASERGVVIVNVTQCLKGHVRASYAAGRAVLDAGVVPGADMTPEAALAKLAFLLGQGLSPDEVRALAGRSLRGELSEEIED